MSDDLMNILELLLPGFLAAWIYYGLTLLPKPSQFERIVQALIYTLIVQLFVYWIKAGAFWIGHWHAIGIWTDSAKLGCTIGVATIVGVVFAYLSNDNRFYTWISDRYTDVTSYPSEWYAAFADEKRYVVLQLNDDRRIMGWPKLSPRDPSKGHFLLGRPQWLVGSNALPIQDVDSILINVKDVKWVEFIEVE
jgi:hypothetical protein